MPPLFTPLEALHLILDQVDYMAGNCRINEAVGAVLPAEVIAHCRDVIEKERSGAMKAPGR
jgi:hypothetical protein